LQALSSTKNTKGFNYALIHCVMLQMCQKEILLVAIEYWENY